MTENRKTPKLRFKGFTDAWEQRKLGDVFKYEQPQTYIVENTEYDDKNKIPVLTAGQSFILGYTDEHFGIKEANQRNPVIIFDDFTTSSHYVDFPFKVKSSAIKLLTLSTTKDNVYCAYNVLKNISYLPVSHERHWISTFTKFDILLPKSVDEQELIGEYFKLLDKLITLHQRKLDRLKNIKKSMLDKMFPKDGEVVPEIRFKGFTDAWEQRKLGEFTISYSGGTPSVGIKEYYNGQIPFIRSAEINSEITELFLTEEGLKNSSARLVDVGDILYALYGATSGEVGRARLKGAVNQAILVIKPHKEYDSEFLTNWLRKNKESIVETYLQGGQGNLSGTIVKELLVCSPSHTEQEEIGSFFYNLDSLITLHQRKLDKLKNIKKSMLDNMFV